MKKFTIAFMLLALFFAQAAAEDAADVALVKQGNVLYKEGRLDEALVYYKKAISTNPLNFFAQMNSGYVYAAKGDNKTALIYLEKAYSLQPEEQLKQGIEKLKRFEKKEFFKTDNPLKFSKKIGFNISTLAGSGASYDLKTGLNTGFEAVYGFGELLSAQAGLFYTQKGGKIKGAIDSFVFLDYIEIPASVKISFTPISELMTGVYFGGSVAVKTAAKNKTAGIETEQSSVYELFDYALLGGIEATYPVFGIFWISADLRFSQGMSDIRKDPLIKNQNPVFTAYFGLIF
jgi:tetratricopeptide (TPR) repeat protein